MKAIEDQWINQVGALKALKPEKIQEDLKLAEELFPKEMKTNEVQNELNEIEKFRNII